MAQQLKDLLGNQDAFKEVSTELFNAFDADKTGFIERSEFKNLLTEFSNKAGIDLPTDSEIDEIMKDLDQNNDNKFSLDEFTTFFRLLLEGILSALETK